MLSMLLVTAAWALPPVPAPLTITVDEQATLDAGDVVFRNSSTGQSIAILDVASSPSAVMTAVMDLAPRVDDIGALLEFSQYDEGPGTKAAQWRLGASVYSATFHVLYEYDLNAGWCVYTLDTSKDNDISSTDGSYQVYANGAGSRLIYRSSQQSSILPAWLMQRFSREGAEELLTGIARRAGG